MFFWRPASVADVAAVNPNGIKTLLATGLNIFLIRSKPVFSNGPKTLPKNSPDCPILCSWVFDSFILVNKIFANVFQNIETSVLVNNNFCGSLCASLYLSFTFDERFKVTAVHFLILNLLNYELANFTFQVLYWVILYWHNIERKANQDTLTVLC